MLTKTDFERTLSAELGVTLTAEDVEVLDDGYRAIIGNCALHWVHQFSELAVTSGFWVPESGIVEHVPSVLPNQQARIRALLCQLAESNSSK